jgi:hypothetical protein
MLSRRLAAPQRRRQRDEANGRVAMSPFATRFLSTVPPHSHGRRSTLLRHQCAREAGERSALPPASAARTASSPVARHQSQRVVPSAESPLPALCARYPEATLPATSPARVGKVGTLGKHCRTTTGAPRPKRERGQGVRVSAATGIDSPDCVSVPSRLSSPSQPLQPSTSVFRPPSQYVHSIGTSMIVGPLR